MIPAIGAAGGGTWLHTLEASYDPGDEVTAVAYVGAAVTDEPVLARMSVAPILSSGETARPGWIELGSMTLEPTGLGGYLETRVSITFTLPDELEAGTYVIEAHTESGAFFGDLLGTSVVVGAAGPSEPRWIEWALDDPLIKELPDSAVIAGPGFAVSVATLKAGDYPQRAEDFMMHPENLPPATTTAVPSFVVEEPSAQTTVVNVSARDAVLEEFADADDGGAIPRNSAKVPSPQPVQPLPESGETFDGISVAGPVAFVAGIILLALVTSLERRWRLAHVEDRSEESSEPEKVLTRT